MKGVFLIFSLARRRAAIVSPGSRGPNALGGPPLQVPWSQKHSGAVWNWDVLEIKLWLSLTGFVSHFPAFLLLTISLKSHEVFLFPVFVEISLVSVSHCFLEFRESLFSSSPFTSQHGTYAHKHKGKRRQRAGQRGAQSMEQQHCSKFFH